MSLNISKNVVTYFPENNTTTYGGSLNTRHILLEVPMTAASQITAVSSSGSDTMGFRIRGFKSSGVSFDETLTLNGTTPVSSVLTDAKALGDVQLGTTSVGTITFTQASGTLQLGTMASGVTRSSELVWAMTGDVAGGSSSIFYGAIGFKNNETLASALSCTLYEASDTPGYGEFGCDTVVNGSATVANRLTALPGITYNGSDKNLPGDTNLDAGEYIVVPIKFTLPAGVTKGQRIYSVGLRYSEA